MTETVTMTAPEWRDRIVPILAHQCELLDRLQQLASRQESLIQEGHIDALLKLLNDRQRLIDAFMAMQRDLTPLLEGAPAWLDALPERDREAVRTSISEIDGQLDAVLKRDEQDRLLLEKARRETRSELGTLANVKQARHAYLTSGAASNSRFADQRG